MQQDHFHPVQLPVWEISVYIQQTMGICQWQSHFHELDVRSHHSTNKSWSNAGPQHITSAISPDKACFSSITKLDLKIALSHLTIDTFFSPQKTCVVGTH